MGDACCDGSLDASELDARQRRVLVVVLGINVATFIMMVAGSWLSGSSSLLSGTMDNLGDAVTYALSLAAVGGSASAKGKVALFKGCLILMAAGAVALHIGYRLMNPGEIVVAAMGVAAVLNLVANGVCLWLLTPHRNDDINMSSVWECSRNDIYDGGAVIVAAGLVWWFQSGWPDLIVAFVLLALFTWSAVRVLRSAWTELTDASSPSSSCSTT